MASIRRNYYGDPGIAEGFNNLAKMFAPPTGAEIYGYANAAKIRTDLARKAEAVARIRSGSGTAADYIDAGVGDPSKNFAIADMYRRAQTGAAPQDLDAGAYAVNGNANNTFAGQRIKLNSDELVAQRNNASTERNALIGERGKIIVAGMSPVGKDQTRFMPPSALPVLNDGLTPGSGQQITSAGGSAPGPSLGSMFGAPPAAPAAPVGDPSAPADAAPAPGGLAGMFGPSGPMAVPITPTAPDPTAPPMPAPAAPPPGPAAGSPLIQYGQTELSPGQQVVRPDGTVLNGPDKPLSLDEAKAREMTGLRKSGVIPDDQMSAIIFGNTPLQQGLDASGRPTFMTGPNAIGAQPAPDASKSSELAVLQRERAAITGQNPDDPRVKEYDSRIAALGRGQQQGAYDQTNDTNFAKENQKIYDSANAARSELGTIRFLSKLYANRNTPQGFAAGAQIELRKAFHALGMSADGADDAQVADALSNKIALAAKNDGGENTMPGSMSDGDRLFLQLMGPSIAKTQGANVKMLDYYARIKERQVDVGRLRDAYVQKHGRLDEGWRRELGQYADANPLFAGEPGYAEVQAGGGAPTPATPTSAAPAAPAAPATPTPAPGGAPQAAAQPKRFKFNPQTGQIE